MNRAAIQNTAVNQPDVEKMFSALLLILMLFSFSATAEQVTQPHLDLGKKHSFQSTHLKEQRSFYVRLPEGYAKSRKSYPVIYLLDANNEVLTYMKDLYFHSVNMIDRMEKRGDIPQSIVVGIPFSRTSWWGNVVGNPEPLLNYLAEELTPWINKNYRTLDNSLLAGQSYSGVFVINALAKRPQTFTSYLSVEPVLASGELEKAIENYRANPHAKANLRIVMGGVAMLHEAEELRDQIQRIAKNVQLEFNLYPEESHGSVYYPALNRGLRGHFGDFREPGESLLVSADFGKKSLKKYYDKRAEKYQVETTDRDYQEAVFNVIFYNLKAKRFERAFELWHDWETPYKTYNANRIINHFLRNNDRASAIKLLEYMTKAMPESVGTLDRLVVMYEEDNQSAKARQLKQTLKTVLDGIFAKPVSNEQEANLNRYGYRLISEKRHQQAIDIFQRIVKAKPQSLNALDSLADGFEAAADYANALNAMNKVIQLASEKEGVDTTVFQQKRDRLKQQLKSTRS